MMRVFDPAHVLLGHLDVQLRQAAKPAPIAAGKRQSAAAHGIGVFHGANHVLGIPGSTDRHVNVARAGEIL